MSSDLDKQWESLETPREILKTRVAAICAENFKCLRTGAVHEFITFRTCDWVNIVAVTPEKSIILIRQFRHGTRKTEWEIPGGCIDRSDRSPEDAGVRELLEETGYAGEKIREIGCVHPNPALQGNLCHTILIENAVKVSEPKLEPTECIEFQLIKPEQVMNMIQQGIITHGLVLNALMFYFLEEKKK